MDTSGRERQEATRGGTGTISRRPGQPAPGARVRPEPVPAPPADPVDPADERRLRRRRPEGRNLEARNPDELPPRTLMTAPPAPPRNVRPAPAVAPRPRAAPAKQRTASSPRTAPSLPPVPPPPGSSPPGSSPPGSSQPGSFQPVRPFARAARSRHRMPFVLMLCGLLSGALISALAISTTLAEGAFQITGLQKATNALARQEQALKEQVARAQSAQVIENRALKLGLRPQGVLRFIDLKTGKISNDRGSAADRAIHVPGYTP